MRDKCLVVSQRETSAELKKIPNMEYSISILCKILATLDSIRKSSLKSVMCLISLQTADLTFES